MRPAIHDLLACGVRRPHKPEVFRKPDSGLSIARGTVPGDFMLATEIGKVREQGCRVTRPASLVSAG